MAARTTPIAATVHRVSASSAASARQGRRQSAKTAAAVTIRSQATPSGSTIANNRTANAGPR
jgi:hypothetical protein